MIYHLNEGSDGSPNNNTNTNSSDINNSNNNNNSSNSSNISNNNSNVIISNESVVSNVNSCESFEQRPQLAAKTSSAQAVLICRKNSHPFSERRLCLEAPVKVGRAVARSKPSSDNSIFDCKVLSRNHALLWFEEQKFFLQDTRSSNGTFINNQRLSPANEESAPREVFSGDVVQFGVDVMENSRKVTHGCIIATIKLYLPDGTEAKAQETQFNSTQIQNQSNVCITSQQLYELSQYLNEAIHREQILENKLETLQRVVTNAHESANSGWKSLVEEDRLLSRIETLQNKLEVCLNTTQNNNKDNESSEDSSLHSIREELIKLIDDKEKYETAAKEAIQKALEEKLIVLTRLHEFEASVKSQEEECNRLQEVCESSAQEINRLANCNDELNREIESYVKRLKLAEDQKIALIDGTNRDKQELELKINDLKTQEIENNEIIRQLKTINETANTTIDELKLQLEVIKQSEKVIIDGISNENINDIKKNTENNMDSGISVDNRDNIKLSLGEDIINLRKQLELSNAKCNQLSDELKALKLQSISTVTLTDSITSSVVDTNSTLLNGELMSTNINNNNSHTEEKSVITEVNSQSDSHSLEQTTSHLSSEIGLLKELLSETRASKKSIEEELSQTLTELENLRTLAKQLESEADNSQQKLEKTLKEIEEKNVLITSLKNQINEMNDKMKKYLTESEIIKCKLNENDKTLNLREDEINSLKVLLEEERKVQIKYANNYELCKKQLCESQIAVKQSQTEAELLRKKVYSRNEELRTSRSNLSNNEETNKSSKEYEKLLNECHSLKTKLHSRESELLSYRNTNSKLVEDFEYLQNSFHLLQKVNKEMESRGDNYWREQFNTAKSDAESHQTQLITVREQLEEMKKQFEESSNDFEVINEKLKSAKEDYEIFSYQSKIATACAIVPLFMLLIAVLMAYYPSISSVTGTTDI